MKAGVDGLRLNPGNIRDPDKVKEITAVLERTCVYVSKDGDRRLARKVDLWVEPTKLPIRRRGIG